MTRSATIKSNAKEFIKRLEATGAEYNTRIMERIASIMDSIRYDSGNKEIIPNRILGRKIVQGKDGDKIALVLTPIVYFRHGEKHYAGSRYRYLRQLQPSVPGKVTERTGQLKETLTSPGSWKYTKRQAKLIGCSPHLNFTINPQYSDNQVSYVGTMAIRDSGPVKNMNMRLRQEAKGRKFFEPAINRNKSNVEPELMRGINAVVNKTL